MDSVVSPLQLEVAALGDSESGERLSGLPDRHTVPADSESSSSA